jgi:hypothetical protein
MPFVVPDICRFAINQSLEGRAVVNVLDYQVDTTGSTMSRSDACEALAGDILVAWQGTVMNRQVDDLTFESVSWVDLNTATGTTGSITSAGAVTLPIGAGETGSPIPANVSALVTKTVSSARGRRNGRMFIAGIPEDATDITNGNTLSTTYQAALNSQLDDFLSETANVDGLGTAYSSDMAVVHVLTRSGTGAPLTGGYNLVTALTVQGLLATQRRRLRG